MNSQSRSGNSKKRVSTSHIGRNTRDGSSRSISSCGRAVVSTPAAINSYCGKEIVAEIIR